MAELKINDGRVEIELGGKLLYLEPSLQACIDIAKMGGEGGIARVIAKCEAYHFETITRVIGAGLIYNGKRLNAQQIERDLPEDIYKAGVFKMMGKAIEFCGIVLNGGQTIPDEPNEGVGDDGDPLDSPFPNSTDGFMSEPQAG